MSVKVQGGKVITKGNKVSCSCCGGCCMYPAQGFFDGLYGETDLPDSIIFTQYDLSGNINAADRVVERSGLSYATNYDNEFSQRYTLVEDYEGLGPRWVFQTEIYDNESNVVTPWTTLDTLDCLFRENADGVMFGAGGTKDNFEDSYEITNPSEGAATVFRTSGCLWEGTTNNGCIADLRYFDANEGQNAHKWLVAWQQFQGEFGCEAIDGGTKVGTQNTPVGDYASDTAFSASVSAP